MLVTPIPFQIPDPSEPTRRPVTWPSSTVLGGSRPASQPGGKARSFSRLDTFALALAGLGSRSRALTEIQATAWNPLNAAGTRADSLMPVPAPRQDGLGVPLAEDPEAIPPGLPPESRAEAVAALEQAGAAAREAVAAMAGAVQAFDLAVVAIATASAAVAAHDPSTGPEPAVPVPGDGASLGGDAVARYLGGGFLGPGSGPHSDPLHPRPSPDVAPVPAANFLAANTYSNPHELAFGQTAAGHPEPLGAVAPASGEDAPGLNLLT